MHDVSFRIPQNTTTAIVGPSGSGKSTLCNLIARFYDVQKGEIKIGGRNIKDFTCDSLLRNISMVFQNVYLFNDSIKNNIRFGNPNATDEEVIDAAKKADAMISLWNCRWVRHDSWRGRFLSFGRRKTAYFDCKGYLEKCAYCHFGRGDRKH